MPPAATTGVAPARSTTWGTSTMVLTPAAVPAGLAALSDDHVGVGGNRLRSLPAVHDLLEPEDAGVVRTGDQVGRDA
jgi:hypothetical protein